VAGDGIKVDTVAAYAFANCGNLTVVNLPDLMNIHSHAFANCSALTHMTFPNHNMRIEDRAFFDCRLLSTVTFDGNRPTYMGRDVFAGHASGFVVQHYDWDFIVVQDVWQNANNPNYNLRKITEVTGVTLTINGVTSASHSVTLTHTNPFLALPVPTINNTNVGYSSVFAANIARSAVWSSDNPQVATVDMQFGQWRINAVSPGTATINAKVTDRGKTHYARILVTVSIGPASVELSQVTMDVAVGQSERLIAEIHPFDVTNRNIIWTSSDPSIASVDQAGLVTGVSHVPGRNNTVRIRAAMASNTSIFRECVVTVIPSMYAYFPVTGINGLPQAASVGHPLLLSGTAFPAYATSQGITKWEVRNAGTTGANVVETQDGFFLHTTGTGTATVDAIIADGRSYGLEYRQTFTVTVQNFVAVWQILDLPSQAIERRPLPLSGLVVPPGATNRTVVWSLSPNHNGPPAEVTGGTLTAWGLGTVMVRATIKNGAGGTATAENTHLPDYVIDFPVTVIPAPARFRLDVQASPAHGGIVTGSGEYEPPLNPAPIDNWQQAIPITASAGAGYRFDGWSFSGTSQTGGGRFRDAAAPSTQFLLPSDPSMPTYTVVARFTYVGAAGGGGSGTQPPSFLLNHFENGNFVHTAGSNLPLIHITQKEVNLLNLLDAVLIGETPLQPGRHYRIDDAQGTTRLTLHAPTLTNLVAGSHILTVRYRDGTAATAMFRVDRGISTVVPFQDVRANDWFAPYVTFVFDRGLVNGTSPTAFSPQANLTQGQAVLVLFRMNGGSMSASADTAAAWAVSNNILPVAGRFTLNEPITRQDFALLLSRYADRRSISLYESRPADAFSDQTGIAMAARAAVTRLNRARIINGRPGNLFDPNGRLTRAEFAAMLQRFIWASV